MVDIIDLDAFSPEPVVIKLQDQEITIKPPTLADVMDLGRLASKLKNTAEMPTDEVTALLQQVNEKIYSLVPELKDKELNVSQLFALISIINKMAVPKDVKELEKQGIKVDGGDGSKKAE